MKKLKRRNWKDEINALLICHHIKKIRQMIICYLRDLLKEAMDIGYGFQQEENLTKHNSQKTQSALDLIHRYETTYPAVSGTKELIQFTEWVIKECKAD